MLERINESNWNVFIGRCCRDLLGKRAEAEFHIEQASTRLLPG
jgi:hypothetical protein